MAAQQDIIYNGVTYFTEAELRCPESGILNLAPGFAEALLKLRLAYGKPMRINRCCSSTAHNAKVGGKPNSYHLGDNGHKCCAVDVAISNSADRALIMREALASGWSIEVRKGYLHLDQRAVYGATQIVFLYEEA